MATMPPLLFEKQEFPTGRLADIDAVTEFLFAGNATITLVSTKTGTRFTYKVRVADDKNTDKNTVKEPPFFVSLMRGPDNENDFCYMGLITIDYGLPVGFKRTSKSTVDASAPSFKAFDWFMRNVVAMGRMRDELEVWHFGRCGRCGRKLTVLSSVAAGIGPECAVIMCL